MSNLERLSSINEALALKLILIPSPNWAEQHQEQPEEEEKNSSTSQTCGTSETFELLWGTRKNMKCQTIILLAHRHGIRCFFHFKDVFSISKRKVKSNSKGKDKLLS